MEAQKLENNIEKVRKNVKTFCSRSTLHGLREWNHERQPILRFIWLLLIVASCTAAAYGTWDILAQYRRSTTAVAYTVSRRTAVDIPDILLCPFSTLSRRFLEQNNVSDELADYLVSAFGDRNAYMHLYSIRENTLEIQAQNDAELERLISRLNLTWVELLENASIGCDDVLLDCKIVTDTNYSCCTNAIREKFWSPFGGCIRLRSPTQLVGGFGWGLTLIVRPLKEDVAFVGRTTLMNRGTSIYLLDRNRWELGDLSFVPEGAHALLGVRTVQYEMMDSKESPCSTTLDVSKTGTQMCIDACFFEHAMRQCNCHYLLVNAYYNVDQRPLCLPKEVHNCIWPAMHEHITEQGDVQSVLEMCRARCPSICAYKQFEPRLSFSNFPSRSIEKLLQNGSSVNNMTDYTILHVFHEQLVIAKVHHFDSLTVHQLLASVGGQMGLYVGGSLLTLVQLFVLICRLPFVACEQRQPL